ncbi:MAG TPA: pantoate--beta-alanine ligase [Lachnospiraceae bacterium]|nr:pantoate--beta-alanine ligase [Lachnospiraceae bacterium]HAQ51200.1 pantoate--beta-alanine ligase [Lachnospiraceae bacterium]
MVARTPKEVKEIIRDWKKQGYSIGLVPTMGYLHEGHGSLIERAVKENDKVMVSVFVNPIQFGPNEDLETYPRDFDADLQMIEKLGADMVFHPEPSDMYAPDFSTTISVAGVSENLCGARRPGHFNGVCTVVTKLFNLSEADRAYFGQKDAQQLAVVRRMVRDLNANIEIIGCPIIREDDGLAKSSRNTYLNPDERKAATVLSKALRTGKQMIESGEKNAEVVKSKITEIISKEPLAKIDYVEITDWNSIEPVDIIDRSTLCAIAVYIGNTRLIDNFIYEV